jgi:hypothetical protein
MEEDSVPLEYDLRDDMRPFPIFPTCSIDKFQGPITGVVRTDLDSIGCHGSSLGAVVYAIGVDDSTWQLNSSTYHFKTNDKSRLYVKTEDTEDSSGWNPWVMGKKKKHIPLCLLPNLSLGRLKTIRGIEMFLTMYLLEEELVRAPCFRHKQCAVVNSALNIAKANYQSFPSYQVEDASMQTEYRLAMANISRFATPSGSRIEQKALKNCQQLFNADVGNVFFAIFWEAILDMGRDTPQCYSRYDEVVNHGVSGLEHLSVEEMRVIAVDFRRTAFFSAQAAGTKNNWDVSETTTSLNLKDKRRFASTVTSLVEKTRMSALRYFNEPRDSEEVEGTELEENDVDERITARQRRASVRDALAVEIDDEDDVETAMGVIPFPLVNFQDRIFTFDIGVVVSPMDDEITFLSNGREADRIIAQTCMFPRVEEDESEFEETNALRRAYAAPPPLFPFDDGSHEPFDGEKFMDFYNSEGDTYDAASDEGASSDGDSSGDGRHNEESDDDDEVSLSQPGVDPNDEHPPEDPDGGPEVPVGGAEEEDVDPLEMLQLLRECRRVRYPKYGTAGCIGNSHKSMVALTPRYENDPFDPILRRISVTADYVSRDVPSAVEGAQMYMNHLRIETMKRTRKGLFRELRYFAECVTSAVTPVLTENDRVKAQKGFESAAHTLKRAKVAVNSIMEDARTVDKKHVRYELVYITTNIKHPLTVPVNSTTCSPLDAILVANQANIFNYRKRWKDEILPPLEMFFGHPSPPSMSAPAKASIIFLAESLAQFLDADSAFLGRVHTAIHQKYPRMARISPPADERVILSGEEKRLTLLRYGVKTRNVPIPQVERNGGAQAARRYRVASAEVEILRKQVRLPVRYATASREVRLAMLKATEGIGADDEDSGDDWDTVPSLLDAPNFPALANLGTFECQNLVKKWARLLYYLYLEEHLALVVQKANSSNRRMDVREAFERLTRNFTGGLPVRVSQAEAIRSEFDFVSLPHSRSQNSSNLPESVRNTRTVTSIGKLCTTCLLFAGAPYRTNPPEFTY